LPNTQPPTHVRLPLTLKPKLNHHLVEISN
jgi:hypothetical protein